MGNRRVRWGIGLTAAGVLSVVVAAVLAWVIVPSRKQLPADMDRTRELAGTAGFLLNSVALGLGDLRNAMRRDVPVTATQTVAVLATDGDAALVSDVRTLSLSGPPVGVTEASYAVDRTTLEPVTDIPESWKVTPHQGLTVGWPIGAEPRDYTAWINATQATTPVTYVREENVGDVRTYVYKVASEPAPITDELVRARLPWGLSAETIAQLATGMPLTADERAQLAAALPKMGDITEIEYTYQLTATYWVEPTTGLVIKAEQREVERVGPSLEDQMVAVVPVYDVSLAFTDASVQQASDRATELMGRIRLYGTIVPLVLAALGIVAIVVGVRRILADRRGTDPRRHAA